MLRREFLTRLVQGIAALPLLSKLKPQPAEAAASLPEAASHSVSGAALGSWEEARDYLDGPGLRQEAIPLRPAGMSAAHSRTQLEAWLAHMQTAQPAQLGVPISPMFGYLQGQKVTASCEFVGGHVLAPCYPEPWGNQWGEGGLHLVNPALFDLTPETSFIGITELEKMQAEFEKFGVPPAF